MGTEIERKFLLNGEGWRAAVQSTACFRQGVPRQHGQGICARAAL